LKAGSKGKKLATKRHARGKVGRPLVEGMAREPNGRISRTRRPSEPVDKLALQARARKMGVSIEQARDPCLATYIGRLYRLGDKAGGISRDQYAAALTFLEVRNNWSRAILSPGATWDECAQRTFGETQEETTRRNIARFEAMMKAIREAQLFNRTDNLQAVLQYIVIDDLELPHMVGTLRVILNVLHKHFFIDRHMS